MRSVHDDVTVGVVDNDPFAVDAVTAMFRNHEAPIRVLWSVTSARDAMAMCDRDSLRPQVVLTDMQMPGMDGDALADELSRKHPDVHVVGMTAFDCSVIEHDFPVLPKESPVNVIVRAIGEAAGDHQTAQWSATRDRGIVLSQSELQVIGLFAQGLTTTAVAGRLHVAETTVKTHLSRVFGKLGVHTKAEAIALCASRGWL
ncbi:response regulator transcription factor [Bifidobacterium leontopitheci]|uniref:DNA-binding response regulator n=1 Tax=Bifidobacterium leontopitheci TaxID=2650774 RepID=A0A6I1GPN5_9BIFI|nr:response regulator transcription factor [Bifidobacterium leontopitheci]KAB7791339.1 DNA-binding response regulator [Bifidobacterium leontopitheci]